MYARSNTLHADPRSIDEGIAYVRDEVLPLVLGLDGSAGMSLLCDRESGRCIATTAWETEEAMRNSDAAVRQTRSRAGEIFRGGAPEVAEWEVAVMHRTHAGHDGAGARVIWMEMDPARMEEVLGAFRSRVLPQVEQLPGFCSVSDLIDRSTGRAALTVAYDSRQDMQRAAGAAAALRRQTSEELGLRITDVAEFDIALHHLRVPELV